MATERRKFESGEIRLGQGERASYRFAILSARQVSYMAGIHLGQFGLTGNSWRVLSIIGYFGPMSGIEVSRRGSLEPDKITRSVDFLKKKGYVLRRQNPADRRKVVLSLSAKGRGVYEKIERVRHAMESELLSALTPRELDTLYRVLDKLEARAEKVLSGKRKPGDPLETAGPRAGERKPTRKADGG